MPAPDGPQFRFLYQRPTESWHDYHLLDAVPADKEPDTGNSVGHMTWFKNSGVVSELFVGEQNRRQGIATNLWNEAQRLSRQDPSIPAPKHSSFRSRSGDAWAKKVGGELPPLDNDEYTEYYD